MSWPHTSCRQCSLSLSLSVWYQYRIALVVVVVVAVVIALAVVAVVLRCCAAVRLHLRQELATLNAISSRTLHTLASRVLPFN